MHPRIFIAVKEPRNLNSLGPHLLLICPWIATQYLIPNGDEKGRQNLNHKFCVGLIKATSFQSSSKVPGICLINVVWLKHKFAQTAKYDHCITACSDHRQQNKNLNYYFV